MTAPIPQLTKQAQIDRKLSQKSLFYLCKTVLGYHDMVPHVHGDLCTFLTQPQYGRYRQATIPRSWFKTWVGTVGGSIWLSLPDEDGIFKEVYPFKGPDVRILIASNISDNAEKMVSKIRHEWMQNSRLKAAFPDLVPQFNKVRWSNSCAELKRKIVATEGTYTSVGAGGGVVSQHFDMIIEDDLIYAKKDDFSGQELMPNQEDIDKAIGWHRLASSLFVHPQQSCLWNIGTRWAPHDLIDHIRTNENKKYHFFEIAVTEKDDSGNAIWPIRDDQLCIWPERFNYTALDDIRQNQGPKIFETQYLNRPRAGEDVTFDASYLNRHDSLEDYPRGMDMITMVDLAGWKDKKRMCNNVVLTGGRSLDNHLWIARVDAGRYNPSEVIQVMQAHQKQFNSRVLVEEVNYQAAIRHFAKKAMEQPGARWYNIDTIPADNKKDAKELRINALEPLVRNGGMHVLRSMRKLIVEMEDYPYGMTRDILDVLGYLFKHANPSGQVAEINERGMYQITRESLEKECEEKKQEVVQGSATNLPFQMQLEDILSGLK